MRLPDALRRGVGPLRRVRPVLAGMVGETRSSCSPLGSVVSRAPTAPTGSALSSAVGVCARSSRSSSPSAAAPTPHFSPRSPPTCSDATRVLCVTAVSPSLAARRARRLPRPRRASGACVTARSTTDELDESRLPAQRRRPLLPLQGSASWTSSPRWPKPKRPPSCSGSTSTTWATTGPASRPPPNAGRVFPLVEAGFTKAEVRDLSRRARVCGPGTSRRPPASPPALPYGTPVTLAAPAGRWRQPRRRCAPSASASSGSATTATWPGSRWSSAECRQRPSSDGTRSSPPSAGAGYRYVTLDLEGFRSGQSQPGHVRGRGASVIEVRVKLTFPEDLVREPVIARLVREHDVEPNIRRANVDEHEGWIVCEIDGRTGAGRRRPGLAPRRGDPRRPARRRRRRLTRTWAKMPRPGVHPTITSRSTFVRAPFTFRL